MLILFPYPRSPLILKMCTSNPKIQGKQSEWLPFPFPLVLKQRDSRGWGEMHGKNSIEQCWLYLSAPIELMGKTQSPRVLPIKNWIYTSTWKAKKSWYRTLKKKTHRKSLGHSTKGVYSGILDSLGGLPYPQATKAYQNSKYPTPSFQW